MQIWKSPYMFVFILKWYPKIYVFWILKILKLFARKICLFFEQLISDKK